MGGETWKHRVDLPKVEDIGNRKLRTEEFGLLAAQLCIKRVHDLLDGLDLDVHADFFDRGAGLPTGGLIRDQSLAVLDLPRDLFD